MTSDIFQFDEGQTEWARMSRILGWAGADPWISGTSYKAVVQVTLLLGSETWVMIHRIGWTLGGFHHKANHCLAVCNCNMVQTSSWSGPPFKAEMEAAGLGEVEACIFCHHNTIYQYIPTHLMLELCLEAERHLGAWAARR